MYLKFIKRVLDCLISGFALIVLSPVFVLAALLILFTMGMPIFFKQERIGKDGQAFKILKFRSMKSNKKAEMAYDFAYDNSRITMIGRLLRRAKIDELPQILNILKGDMSVVGPRPTIRLQVEAYTPRERERLSVPPGLTGWAQVNGNTSMTWAQRIEYDLDYINHISFIRDVKIIAKTVAVVIAGESKFSKKEQIIETKENAAVENSVDRLCELKQSSTECND